MRLDSQGARVIVGMLAAACIAYLLASLWADDQGFVYDGTTVLEVDPGGAADRAGMRVGDTVVADPLDTHQLDDDRAVFAWGRRLDAAILTGAVRYEVERDHHRLVLIVGADGPTLEAAIRQLRGALPDLPIAVTFFALAFLCARRARQDHRARARLAVGFALAGSYFALTAVLPYSGVLRDLWSLATSLSVLGFMLIAQGAWALGRRASRVARVVQPVTCAVGVASAVVIFLDVHALIPRLPLHNLVHWLGHAAMFASLITAMIVLWRECDEPADRRAARAMFALVVIGTLLPLLLAAAWVFATISLPSAQPALWQLHVLTPIAITAAAARAGYIELEGRLPAVVLYAIALGGAWVIYTALTALADVAFSGPVSTEAARSVTFAIVIVAAEPLRAVMRRGLDVLFARDRMLLITRCTQLCAELAGITDRAAIELAVRNVLHARAARICTLAELSAEPLASRLAGAGALRVVDVDDAHLRDALRAGGADTLVHVPGERVVLAIGLPLAPPAWDRAERRAVASIGQVIGSVMQQHAARQALERRVARDEAERRGIAMELHDGLGATLTAARLMAQMVRRTGLPAHDTLDGLETTLQSGLRDLRIALWGLEKDAITWGELVATLRRQLGDVCAAAGLALELDSDVPDDELLGPAAGFALHRILQEALTNTVKHAGARHIRCRVLAADHGARLVFEDDGRGLPSPVPAGRGLANMRRRIAALGGTFELSACPAGGTRIEVWLPARPHDHAIDAAAAVHHG